MLDLLTSRKYPLDVFNSEEAESYHSWSGNGRWMVFSSRRIDGLYTRLFIGYVDSEGVGHKPFLLPQKDPLTYYDALMFSYNIPELMRSAVTVDLSASRLFEKRKEIKFEVISESVECLGEYSCKCRACFGENFL